MRFKLMIEDTKTGKKENYDVESVFAFGDMGEKAITINYGCDALILVNAAKKALDKCFGEEES